MTDIVERLEKADFDMLWRDAIAEIVELRTENERLRAELKYVHLWKDEHERL